MIQALRDIFAEAKKFLLAVALYTSHEAGQESSRYVETSSPYWTTAYTLATSLGSITAVTHEIGPSDLTSIDAKTTMTVSVPTRNP
jgi:hypothetical protein